MSHQTHRLLPVLLLATGLLLGSVRVSAHHSFAAEFDINKPITLRGRIVKIELINPHSWIHIEVIDKNGVVRHASYGVSARGHAAEVLDFVRSMKCK